MDNSTIAIIVDLKILLLSPLLAIVVVARARAGPNSTSQRAHIRHRTGPAPLSTDTHHGAASSFVSTPPAANFGRIPARARVTDATARDGTGTGG